MPCACEVSHRELSLDLFTPYGVYGDFEPAHRPPGLDCDEGLQVSVSNVGSANAVQTNSRNRLQIAGEEFSTQPVYTLKR